jgi:hypothetical protein
VALALVWMAPEALGRGTVLAGHDSEPQTAVPA